MIQLVEVQPAFEDPAKMVAAIGITEGLQTIAKFDLAAAEICASSCRDGWNGNVHVNGKRIGDFTPHGRYGDFVYGTVFVDEAGSTHNEHANIRQLLPDNTANLYDDFMYPARLYSKHPRLTLCVLLDTIRNEDKEMHEQSSDIVTNVNDIVQRGLYVDPTVLFEQAVRIARLERLHQPVTAQHYCTAATMMTIAKQRNHR